MAALVKSAASPKMFRRNYKRMLRQQHGQTSMSGKSAVRPLAIRFSVDIVCSRSERRLRAQRRSLDFSLRAQRD
jgi:hypothetical protein